jgi:spermidine/putrescine transport system permease protein
MSAERRRPGAPGFAKFILWMMLGILYLPFVVLLGQTALAPESLAEVLRDEALLSALGNSLFVAFFTAGIATLLGTCGSLALHRQKNKWNKVLEGLSLVSLMFPEIVFALALLAWFFVLRWELGLTTVIIAHISFSLSYVMMAVSSRLATLDVSLEDAARDLGASEGKILTTVLLPLLKPAIGAGFILSFLLSFDDFLITYFVNGVGSDTLPVRLYSAMKTGMNPKLTALSSLMLLLSLGIVVLLFRTPFFRQMSVRVRENPVEG